MSHPQAGSSRNLHNPLSLIIMALSLAGDLGRKDEDDCVDLGDKKQLQVMGSSAVSKVILTTQMHICIHIWRCGGSRGLGPR